MILYNVVLGFFAIFGGLYCVIYPDIQNYNIGFIIGFLMILLGACTVIDFFLSRSKKAKKKNISPMGVGSLIAGILLIIFTLVEIPFFNALVIILFDIGIACDSISGIVIYSKSKKDPSIYSSKLDLVLSIIELVAFVGIFIVYFAEAITASNFIGIVLFTFGVRKIIAISELFSEKGKDVE